MFIFIILLNIRFKHKRPKSKNYIPVSSPQRSTMGVALSLLKHDNKKNHSVSLESSDIG
jgi:hypothetical protein